MDNATNEHYDSQKTEKNGSSVYLYLVAMVATVGGLLFGFDTTVISGAIVFIKKQFELTPLQEGWTVSCVLVGCVVGVSFAGLLSDRFGRKKGLILSAVLFTISAIGSAISRNMTELIVARFIGGVGVGAASILSPMYIAEISPARIRGRLVSLNQLTIVFGILVTYIVNWLLVDIGPNNWRWMLGVEAFPSTFFLIALFFVPESPRWLIKQGCLDRAFSILSRVGGQKHATEEIKEIKNTIARESGSVFQLFEPGLRTALVIGVLLAIFIQVTGIDTILYYAPQIFIDAGYKDESSAFMVTIIIGIVSIIFTVLALCVIDKIGRRLLLLVGFAGMAVFLLLLGIAFLVPAFPPSLICAIIICYLSFFMVGLGPGFWVLVSEIYPTRIRGCAMGIVTAVLWAAGLLPITAFPVMIVRIGKTATFWIFALICLVSFVFVWLVIPETKGKTLEEIELFWKQ